MSSSTTTKHYIMQSIIYLNASREGYGIDQVVSTMTVGDLINHLSQYDEDSLIYLRHDGGYTYGGITDNQFQEDWIEDEEDEMEDSEEQ